MKTIEHNNKQSVVSCADCSKNQLLIQKYQDLISLLKRKANKAHSSSRFCDSAHKSSVDDRTTHDNTLQALPKKHRAEEMCFVLLKKLFKTQCGSFLKIKVQSSSQLLKKAHRLYQILTEHQNRHIRASFDQIRSKLSCLGNSSGYDEGSNQSDLLRRSPEVEKTENSLLTSSAMTQKLSLTVAKQENSLSNNLSSFSNGLLNNCSKISNKSFLTGKMKEVMKRMFVLEQQNACYVEEVKVLSKKMEDALSRQIKDNRKKTESLEMVAEEMQEKNQIIQDLQQKITMLEDRHNYEANGVLEDELTTNRKEIQKLEKINIKLDNDLRNVRESLKQTEEQLSVSQSSLSSLQAQKESLLADNFSLQNQACNFQRLDNQMKQSFERVQKIIKRLRRYLRPQLSEESIVETLRETQEAFKTEVIFSFLFNIEDSDFEFEKEYLFDSEQLEVLYELRRRVESLKQEAAQKVELMEPIMSKNPKRAMADSTPNKNWEVCANDKFNRSPCLSRFSNQQLCVNQNMADASIFEVLNEKNSAGDSKSLALTPVKGTVRNEPSTNLTMKLLQMELEKNKQIQKISELKEKVMHIRNIVLNLLKSLEIKHPIKTETEGILEVLFDVFEYSEEERELIFQQNKPREKKFFGLI